MNQAIYHPILRVCMIDDIFSKYNNNNNNNNNNNSNNDNNNNNSMALRLVIINKQSRRFNNTKLDFIM